MTTLAQIAEVAEIAPSTLHAYFPSKQDILFVEGTAMYDSIRDRVIERPPGETFVDAMQGWVSSILPELVAAESTRIPCNVVSDH